MLEIMEVTGCQPEHRSKEPADSPFRVSTNMHIRGIILEKALSLQPN